MFLCMFCLLLSEGGVWPEGDTVWGAIKRKSVGTADLIPQSPTTDTELQAGRQWDCSIFFKFFFQSLVCPRQRSNPLDHQATEPLVQGPYLQDHHYHHLPENIPFTKQMFGHYAIEWDQKKKDKKPETVLSTVKDAYGWHKRLISCLLSRQSVIIKKTKNKTDNHMNLRTSAPVGSPSVSLKLMVWAIHRAASHRNYHAAYQKGYETMGLWVRRLDILSRCQMPVWAATWESCSVRQTWRKGSITAQLELSR